MSYRICTPVVGETIQEFLQNLEIVQSQSDFIELRVDFIQNLTMENLQQIQKLTTKSAIFTCRASWEGGKWNGAETDRLQVLQWGLSQNFDYVDVEVKTAILHSKPLINPKDKPKKKKNLELEKTKPVAEIALDLNQKSASTQLILSYHNFQKTDSYRNLRKIQKQMRGFNCDIQKFACMITKSEDNIILARLLTSKEKTEEMVVLGMGKDSRFMRINTLLLGSYLTFATVGGQVSASGQMSLEEVRNELGKY
jgi:3-dehydroquinate dehydratase